MSEENKIIATVFIVITGIVALAFLFISEIKESKNDRSACESIGGEYVLIDEEFVPAHKSTVYIYGCVRKDDDD